jgi:general secretion pathway protein B
MSFLLDALRKSEQAGRHRAAPTIHSTDSLGYPARDAKDEWLPMLLLVLPAFILMCWFGLRQFDAGPGAMGERRTAQQSAVPAGSPVETSRPAAAGQDAAKPPAAQPAPFDQTGSAVSAKPAPRTPVEQLAAETASDAVLPDTPAAEPPSAQAVAQPPARVATQAPPETAREPAAVKPSPAQAASPSQNHINYWELPGNVREQLPAFRISVLVYAEQPQDRFILVNGTRRYEGDELQSGLVLQEIRRDGAIFSFRRYRFLVTQ